MNPKILERAGLTFLAVILFCFGFYLGIKYTPVDSNSTNKKSNSDSLSLNPKPGEDNLTSANKIVGKDGLNEIKEISWIKTGQEPICPQTHPIKGRLTNGQKLYYLPENKSASRVKPDICFTNEQYAKDIAGFIRKF